MEPGEADPLKAAVKEDPAGTGAADKAGEPEANAAPENQNPAGETGFVLVDSGSGSLSENSPEDPR